MARPVDIRKIINSNIRYYMGFNNFDQKDVAAIMGVTPGTISRRMNLKGNTSYEVLELQRFATKCKCTVADLVTPKEAKA